MIDLIEDLGLDPNQNTIIKVMGVGGGGCNAVNYMYAQGIRDVSFLVCNTDKQCLGRSSVPAKLQLGPGLGAGGKPEIARQYAEENRERIREALNDGTKMLFLTAGMGGGTGTGASSIVAQVAQEMNILTVGIVTIPFAFEGQVKIRKAMTGVAELAEQVDALLVINNEKLRQIYPDFDLLNAFSKSDDVVCNAAKAIAEIITVPGYINTDFADVYNTLKKGNVAIMNVGRASGENRITNAIHDALHSPLVNTNDVRGAKRILLQFYCSTEHAIVMTEIDQIHHFVNDVGEDVEVQWGASLDESLGEDVRVTVIATGYEVSDIPGINEVAGKKSVDEAIDSFYKDVHKVVTTPTSAAEQTTAESASGSKSQTESAPERTPGVNDDEIIIQFDEPFAAVSQPKAETENAASSASRLPNWMRGRRLK